MVTLSAAYTPWGDMVEVNGQGSLTSGYFGGMLDAATGLIYVGKGQYYDPATGRFLTRGVNPDQSNPYVPWRSDPLGVMFAPLVLLGMVYGGKKKRGKWDQWVILLVLCGAVGMSLSACGGDQDTLPPTEQVITPEFSATIDYQPTAVTITVIPTENPGPGVQTPTFACIVSPTIEPGAADPIDPNHMWDVLDKPEDRHMYYKQSLFRHAKDLPQEIPVELFIAIGWAETGENYFWNNDYIPEIDLRDGIMQVTDASGYHEKWARENQNGAFYNNTPMGIESNVIDAISYLNDLSVNIDNYKMGYGNAFDNICKSRTI